MRTSAQIKSSITDLRGELDSLVQASEAAGRDLTAKESQRADEIVDSLSKERQELERVSSIEKERNNGRLPEFEAKIRSQMAESGMSNGTASTKWNRDSRGRGFAVLSKNDKAADILRPQADHEFGHYVIAKLFGASKSTPQSVMAAMTSNDNSLGGFLVPERLSGDVIDLARAKSVLAQAGTRTVLMDSDNLTVPKLTGDAVVHTKAENGLFTASNLTFGARRLDTYTAGALVKMSRELAEDAPELLAEQLQSFLASAMATQVDQWGLAGTGSAQPLGILGRSEIDDTGAIGAIDWQDVAAAATAVRNANHEPTSAIMNTEVYADLFNTEVGDGVNASRGWLNAPPTLANVQFLQTTNCPLAKMIVGDFSRYLMGMRTGAMVEATTVSGEAFERHQVWVKITMRFDFVTMDDSAFHILDGITS